MDDTFLHEKYSITGNEPYNIGVQGGIEIYAGLRPSKSNKADIKILFSPNAHCLDEEANEIQSFTFSQSEEQNTYFEHLDYLKTLFHEGAKFGLHYAFDLWSKANTGHNQDMYVKVVNIINKSGTTHDLIAYCACMALLNTIHFKPVDGLPFYDAGVKAFLFPNTEKEPPLGRVTQNELRKTLRLRDNLSDDEITKLLSQKFAE